MSSTEFGRKLRALRIRADYSQGELARMANVDRSYISMLEAGKSHIPRRDVMVAFAKALEVPVEELLAAAGYMSTESVPESGPPLAKLINTLEATLEHLHALTGKPMIGSAEIVGLRRVPLLGRAPAGPMASVEEWKEGDVYVVAESLQNVVRPYAIKVSGHSMEPDLTDGDIVIVDPDAEWADGDIVVAVCNGETTIKRAYRRDDSLVLEAANFDYPEIIISESQVYLAGVVIGRQPPFAPLARGRAGA